MGYILRQTLSRVCNKLSSCYDGECGQSPAAHKRSSSERGVLDETRRTHQKLEEAILLFTLRWRSSGLQVKPEQPNFADPLNNFTVQDCQLMQMERPKPNTFIIRGLQVDSMYMK